MKKMLASLAVLATLAISSGSAVAQSMSGTLFKEKDVTESALINALTPPPAAAPESLEPTIRTRSIRIRPEASGGMATEQPRRAEQPRQAEASLLITFETNSADLTPKARSALDVVARALNSDQLANLDFSIEGHADPRGSTDLNQRLSHARAESVVDYLVASHRVPRERLRAIGKGDQELMNPSNPAAPENRRVTIKAAAR